MSSGRLARGIGKNVCALFQPIRRGKFAAIDNGQGLPRQDQCNGALCTSATRQGNGGFIGVGGPNGGKVGITRQAGQVLNRLMRWAVFSQEDAVVSENINCVASIRAERRRAGRRCRKKRRMWRRKEPIHLELFRS